MARAATDRPGDATPEGVVLEPGKEKWHPSIPPGQIILTPAMDRRGQPNPAPERWITMAAFPGPAAKLLRRCSPVDYGNDREGT